MIELILPWPPSVNSYKVSGRLRRTRSGKLVQPKVNSPETMEFYVRVINHCRREGIKYHHGEEICLEVILSLHPPDKRRSDIDNRVKITLDALQHAGVIINDSQITRLVVERCHIISGGQVNVRISPHEPQQRAAPQET